MKLYIFAALLTVAACYPTIKTWTLNELSEVIEKSEGDPEMRKYYIDALNIIMYALFTGKNEAAVHAVILSPSGKQTWKLAELKTALEDPHLDKTLRPFYERSYHYLVNEKPENPQAEVEVAVPALDISTWSMRDVTDAMENPETKPGLQSYLEKAKKEIKKGLKKKVTMITPVGLIRHVETNPKIVAKVISDPDKSIPSILSLL